MPLDLPRDDPRSDSSFPFEILEFLDFDDPKFFAVAIGLVAFFSVVWFIMWMIISVIDACLSPSGVQRLGL